MTRYQVGQKILVSFFEISGRNMQKLVGNMFSPWDERLKYMHLVELTVEQHVKVPYEHAPEAEPKCDGFILRDKRGRVWHNQYPTASYGQLSTDADYYFNLAGEDGYPGHTDALAYFEDVTVMIDRVSRGIRDMKDLLEDLKRPPEQRKDPMARHGHVKSASVIEGYVGFLERHRTWMVKRIEHEHKANIEIRPYLRRYTDGRPPETIDSIQVARLHWQGQPELETA